MTAVPTTAARLAVSRQTMQRALFLLAYFAFIISNFSVPAFAYKVRGNITVKTHTEYEGTVTDWSVRYPVAIVSNQSRSNDQSFVVDYLSSTRQTSGVSGCRRGTQLPDDTKVAHNTTVQNQWPVQITTERTEMLSTVLRPVPLKLRLTVPEVSLEGLFTFFGCDNNWRVVKHERKESVRIPGFDLELPDPLNPPFPSTINLSLFLPLNSVLANRVNGQPEATAEIHITFLDLPVPVADVSNLKPERGEQVVFDASHSSGDFYSASWLFFGDQDKCKRPEVRGLPVSSTSAPPGAPLNVQAYIDAILNPLVGGPFDEDFLGDPNGPYRWMYVRSPGRPDRLIRKSPVLCPIKARLVLNDGDFITVSKDVVIVPRARNWSTSKQYEFNSAKARTVQKFQSFSSGRSEVAPFDDYLRDNGIFAMNVPEHAIFGDTVAPIYTPVYQDYRSANAFRNTHLIGHQLVIGHIPWEIPDVGLFDFLDAPLRPNIREMQEEGPFSGWYFVAEPPTVLFRDIGIARSDILTSSYRNTFIRVVQSNHGTAQQGERSYDLFIEYVEFHEFMHTYFENRLYETSTAQPGSGPNSTRPNGYVYDPATVIEQMYDSDVERLVRRVIDVYNESEAWCTKFDEQHSMFHNWRAWVRPDDTFKGVPIADEIAKFGSSISVLKQTRSPDGTIVSAIVSRNSEFQ